MQAHSPLVLDEKLPIAPPTYGAMPECNATIGRSFKNLPENLLKSQYCWSKFLNDRLDFIAGQAGIAADGKLIPGG